MEPIIDREYYIAPTTQGKPNQFGFTPDEWEQLRDLLRDAYLNVWQAGNLPDAPADWRKWNRRIIIVKGRCRMTFDSPKELLSLYYQVTRGKGIRDNDEMIIMAKVFHFKLLSTPRSGPIPYEVDKQPISWRWQKEGGEYQHFKSVREAKAIPGPLLLEGVTW